MLTRRPKTSFITTRQVGVIPNTLIDPGLVAHQVEIETAGLVQTRGVNRVYTQDDPDFQAEIRL